MVEERDANYVFVNYEDLEQATSRFGHAGWVAGSAGAAINERVCSHLNLQASMRLRDTAKRHH